VAYFFGPPCRSSIAGDFQISDIRVTIWQSIHYSVCEDNSWIDRKFWQRFSWKVCVSFKINFHVSNVSNVCNLNNYYVCGYAHVYQYYTFGCQSAIATYLLDAESVGDQRSASSASKTGRVDSRRRFDGGATALNHGSLTHVVQSGGEIASGKWHQVEVTVLDVLQWHSVIHSLPLSLAIPPWV